LAHPFFTVGPYPTTSIAVAKIADDIRFFAARKYTRRRNPAVKESQSNAENCHRCRKRLNRPIRRHIADVKPETQLPASPPVPAWMI
jgi:hypothetical protein